MCILLSTIGSWSLVHREHFQSFTMRTYLDSCAPPTTTMLLQSVCLSFIVIHSLDSVAGVLYGKDKVKQCTWAVLCVGDTGGKLLARVQRVFGVHGKEQEERNVSLWYHSPLDNGTMNIRGWIEGKVTEQQQPHSTELTHSVASSGSSPVLLKNIRKFFLLLWKSVSFCPSVLFIPEKRPSW